MDICVTEKPKYINYEIIGRLFFEQLNKFLTKEDIDLFLKIIHNDKEQNIELNSQVTDSMQQLAFSIMLIYGDKITLEKNKREDIRDTILSELNKVYLEENAKLAGFIEDILVTYEQIKNKTFKKPKKVSNRRIFRKLDLYVNRGLDFLLEHKIVKKKIFWRGYTIINPKSLEEIRKEVTDICVKKRNEKNDYLNFLKEYSEKHLF